ncbi:MAG: Ig-like domain-containing protein [Betaproteobacteria bacterium]|nr:Ig-like domain-containing protein [Betaproteobacteria bacterium]
MDPTTIVSQKVRALGVATMCILPLSQVLAAPQDPAVPQGMAVSYVGEGTRVSVGKANAGSLRGEISHAFAGDETSAWIGETWFGKQVGGVKLSRHWLRGEPEKDSVAVAKVFAAWDRNMRGDQKLTLGGGGENESLFWGGYGALGLSGRRDAGTSTSSRADTIYGTDPNFGDYTQQLTTTTTLRTFEQAYDYGVGARLGHHYQPLLVRLTAGLDHEWGQASSNQTTASLGIEKFFTNSPHSILLNLASASRRGDFETDRHDHRVGLFWRYEMGGQPGQAARAAKTMGAGATASSAAPGASTVSMLPAATTSLAGETVRQPEWIRRAIYNPVRHKQEVDVYRTQERNVTTSAGDRVYRNRAPLAVDDAVSWPNSGKPIDVLANDSDPDGDALRVIGVTPGAHGQTAIRADGKVDYVAQSGWEGGDQFTYTVSDGKNGGTASARVTIAARPNLPPVAVDDRVSWLGSQMPAIIDVLVNDSDPDGDKIAVVGVTNGANGAVSIRPDGKLNYMINSLWNGTRIVDPYWEGTDQFTYTISDGKGGTATARVTIVIIDP